MRSTPTSLRFGFVLWTIVVTLVGTVSVALAAMYNISTTDDTITDWVGVSVFQTDPRGEVTNADEDIINVWVASSLEISGTETITNLNFLMETAGAPALNRQYRGAAAIMDCDGDGVGNEDHDRMVIYGRNDDMVSICQGNRVRCFYEGDCESDCPFGERVGNTAFVEWRVRVTELPPDGLNSNNCRNSVSIRFATLSVYLGTTIIDQTSPLRGWNIPTVVQLQDFRATSRERESAVRAAFLSLMGVLGTSIWAYRRRLRSELTDQPGAH
jgi:hypothetical protein